MLGRNATSDNKFKITSVHEGKPRQMLCTSRGAESTVGKIENK